MYPTRRSTARQILERPVRRVGLILAERFAPHLDYISCSLFLENGDAVLQTFHLLAGIAHFLAIGQLIRDDDV